MKHLNRTAPEMLLATLLVASACVSVDAVAAPLEITLDEVRSTEGMILVQIVDGEAGFDGAAAPVASLMLHPSPPSVVFSVDLEPGVYGVRIMQDLDSDQQMDSNFVGMPTEPWAFSNNAVGNFGPPTWEDVRFEMTTAPSLQRLSLVH